MKISLDNAVLAMSEYVGNMFSEMKPGLLTGLAAAAAHYKLQTQGVSMLGMLAGDQGYIDLDILDGVVRKYLSNMHDETFKTSLGEIKIKSDTPAEVMEILKKYGEN